MAVTNAYCTLAQVQADIRNTSAPVAELEAGIIAASRWIDRHTGRDFLFHDHTASPLVLWGSDALVSPDMLLFPYSPVILLTEVADANGTLVEGEDYRIDGGYRLLPIGREFSTAPTATYTLTGTFGYAETSPGSGTFAVPDHIARAAVMLAATLSGHQRKDVVGLDGQRTTVTDRTIPKEVFSLLGPAVTRR